MQLKIQMLYMTKIILDANYIVAILDEKDISYKKAMDIRDRLLQIKPTLIFFDCVINEVVSVFVRRLLERKHIHLLPRHLERLNSLIPKEKITWVYPDMEDYYDAVIHLVEKSQGHLNFHDALITVVANELEISHIISFDKGFDKTKLKRIKDAGDI